MKNPYQGIDAEIWEEGYKAALARSVVSEEEIEAAMKCRFREHPRMSWQELYPLMARDVAALQLRKPSGRWA